MRRSTLALPRRAALPFRLDWINVDADLPKLIEGLRTRGAGTLLFHGPPGTGKTELARHLAHALDRPLHAKKASDLLSPWVGQTEQLIARAFEQAGRDDAVLLIDEADSFLRERQGAERSWEVTQVNELLAQLDAFASIAVFTTNFLETLDRAALRRFDRKLSFSWMRAEQCRDAFETLATSDAATRSSVLSAISEILRNLQPVALGDFIAALQAIKLEGEAVDVARLHKALVSEIKYRSLGSRAIGFCSV